MIRELIEFLKTDGRCRSFGDSATVCLSLSDLGRALLVPDVVVDEAPACYSACGLRVADLTTVIRLALFGKHPNAIAFQHWFALQALPQLCGWAGEPLPDDEECWATDLEPFDPDNPGGQRPC